MLNIEKKSSLDSFLGTFFGSPYWMTIITVGYHFGSGYGADSKPARKYIKQELFKSPRDLFF